MALIVNSKLINLANLRQLNKKIKFLYCVSTNRSITNENVCHIGQINLLYQSSRTISSFNGRYLNDYSTISCTNCSSLLKINQENFTLQKRYKKGKKGRREETKQEEDEDEDEDEDEVEEDTEGLGAQETTTTLPSLRLDSVAKVGFGFTRAKVEEIFYDSRIRLNGERVSKKSMLTKEGDEIDVILGLNSENLEMLDIHRVEIAKVEDKASSAGRIKINLRKYRNMVIHNYDDPYTGLLIHSKKSREDS